MKAWNNLKARVSTSVKTKAKELYDSATPKVQESLEKLASTKAEDAIKSATTLAVIGFTIYSIISAVNGANKGNSADRGNIINYYEVHSTYNYYYGGKKDEST